MKGRSVKANQMHEAIYQELAAILHRHSDGTTAEEILAIGANMLGKLMAMQDQRTTTPERALEIVIKNIELGNRQAVAQLMQSQGSA